MTCLKHPLKCALSITQILHLKLKQREVHDFLHCSFFFFLLHMLDCICVLSPKELNYSRTPLTGLVTCYSEPPHIWLNGELLPFLGDLLIRFIA